LISSRSTDKASQKEYPPEKIVKVLAAICKRRKIEWPVKVPSPYNITIESQDYGFYTEVCSLLISGLGWSGLREFIYEVTGKTSSNLDWSSSYREALRLAMLGMGLKSHLFFVSEDGKSPIPDRLKMYKLWGIDPGNIKIKEDTDVKKKQEAAKKDAATATTSSASKTKVKEESSAGAHKTVPTKSLKPPKAGPSELPEQTFGGLELASAFLEAIADYADQAAKEAPGDERVKELADALARAAKLLGKIVGA